MDDELTPHLENIVTGGLMRTATPDHIAEQLLEKGLVRKAVGGLMPTKIGHETFMKVQSK